MTLPEEPKKAQDRHYGMLTSRWEGYLERQNILQLKMAGGHTLNGRLISDKKGYGIRDDYFTEMVYHFEVGDVVAVGEKFETADKADLKF